MASMYSAKVMEHFANPHNVGELPDANGVGEVGNPKCGDIMRMYLKIENNVIVDVKFLTFGCGAAIAASSMATAAAVSRSPRRLFFCVSCIFLTSHLLLHGFSQQAGRLHHQHHHQHRRAVGGSGHGAAFDQGKGPDADAPQQIARHDKGLPPP